MLPFLFSLSNSYVTVIVEKNETTDKRKNEVKSTESNERKPVKDLSINFLYFGTYLF